MRIKARALGIAAEDYFNDKVLEDTDLLYPGCANCPRISGTRTARRWNPGSRAATPSIACTGRSCSSFLVNEFVYLESRDKPFYARSRSARVERPSCRR